MSTRYFALVVGLVYTILAVIAFLPGVVQSPPLTAPELVVETGYGYLLGIFPVNVIHTIVHLLLGLWGLAAFRSFAGSRSYARTLTAIFGLLAIMGIFPVLRTTFGLIPLWGNDVWLHGGTAAVAAYFGWAATRPAEEEGPETARSRA